jgi:8-oxo-dGTP pyrophosphatase MutT (NUDIX family)
MISAKKVAKKVGKRTQVAALCFRTDGDKGHEILLVTSRGSRRWIPPKGWTMEGLSPQEAAAQEALEEAGVKGEVYDVSLGCYDYVNFPNESRAAPNEAYIFPLRVKKKLSDFKEKGQRRAKWFSPRKAAALVREPKLKKIIRRFDPTALPPQ